MSLPDEFNSFEHLQDTWRKVHNRRVREHFRDLADPDQEWDATIETPRGALRVACTMSDNDTADMIQIRSFLFWVVLGEAAALQTPVYGLPIPGYQASRRFHPQIQLYFQEDHADIEEGYAPVTGEISFRLMNQTAESLSEAEVNQYALRVRSAFALGMGYIWKKGKLMCSYTDIEHGYKLQLLCRSKSDARDVIEKVLDIQNHTPNWKFLNVSENEETMERYPTIPGNQYILGKSRRKPRARPIANVRFKFASLHIWGLPNPITLIDLSGTRRNAVIDQV